MIGVIAPVLAVEEFIETSDGPIHELCFHPAGQGANVARTISELGEHCTITGFMGGESGIILETLLTTCGISRRLVPTCGATAAIVKITHDYNDVSTYTLPNPIVTRHESDDLYSAASLLVMECPIVVISSVLASGMPSDFYARLIRLARHHGTRTIVDIPPELLQESLAAGPTAIKPNIDQLRSLYGLGQNPSLEDVRHVADRLCEQGASAVVLSLGKDGALVVERGRAWQLTSPQVEAVVEAGAGDSMVGGIAVGLARGLTLVDAARLGAAAGAATVLRHGLGSCKRPIVEQLLPRIAVRSLRSAKRAV